MEHAGWAHEAKKNATWLIVLGVLTVILGILAITSPYISGMAVTLFIGGLLAFMGVLQIIAAFKSGHWGSGIVGTLIGLLSIGAGLLMIFRPTIGMASLTLFLAAYFLVDGIFEVITAFKMRPEKGWGWMLFNGIIAGLLGFLLWRQWPFSGSYAIGLLFGIHILLSGIVMIVLGFGGRRIAGGIEDTVEEVYEGAKGAAAGLYAAAKDAAEDAADAGGRAADAVVDTSKDVAEDISDAAEKVIEKAKDLLEGDDDKKTT
jgi:uncharacterized membrane protein HdeD (DUF308 family)